MTTVNDCTDKNEVLAKALMMLDSPKDWEDVAPVYRDVWRKKARLIQDELAKSGYYVTNQ